MLNHSAKTHKFIRKQTELRRKWKTSTNYIVERQKQWTLSREVEKCCTIKTRRIFQNCLKKLVWDAFYLCFNYRCSKQMLKCNSSIEKILISLTTTLWPLVSETVYRQRKKFIYIWWCSFATNWSTFMFIFTHSMI